MALEVGIVGLPNSGKTTLFNALTSAGAEITAYASVADKPNLGMATIDDDRLPQVAQVVGSANTTPAAIRISDVPGTGAALLGNLRGVDALLGVVDGFSPDADPTGDRVRLQLELLVADRDHVERRLERVAKQAKSGEAALKQEAKALEDILAHLEAEQPLSTYLDPLPVELEPLTTKPFITIENGPEGIDCQLEAELAELEPADAAEFREGPSALDRVVKELFEILDLIVFFTANENEARAWTLECGGTVLDAAASVHTDMARGFIRCEVIRWDALVECRSRAEAAKRGLQALEGKAYVVQDGDVLNIRFNV